MTTTNEIADKIAADQNITKAQAKAIVESVFKQITDAAKAGAETSIPAFGKFKVKATPEREGRNPATSTCGPTRRTSCSTSRGRESRPTTPSSSRSTASSGRSA